jgi:hypothetical protein
MKMDAQLPRNSDFTCVCIFAYHLLKQLIRPQFIRLYVCIFTLMADRNFIKFDFYENLSTCSNFGRNQTAITGTAYEALIAFTRSGGESPDGELTGHLQRSTVKF